MGKPLANVTAFFQFLWSQVLAVASAVGGFFANLVGFILGNLMFIFLLGFLIALGAIWTRGGNDEIIEAVEFTWRCLVHPFLEPFLFLLEPLADLSDALVCWWNALSLWNRLVSRRLITGVLRQCTEFNYRDFFFRLAEAAKVLSVSLNWVTTGLGTGPFPFYPIICELLGAASEFGNIVTCLCANVRVVGDIITRILLSNELCCAIHHALNGLVYSIQSNIAWGYEALVNFAQLLTLDPNGFQALADSILSGTGPYAAVPIFPLTERWAASAAQTAQFGNHFVGTIACSIVGEVETGGFQPAFSALAFAACMTPNGSPERNATCAAWAAEDAGADVTACIERATVRINLFGWAGALLEAFLRLLAALYQLGANAGRVISEFLTLPAGDRFATQVWQLDAFWDSLRVPPPELGGPTASKINVATNPLVYGNFTQLNATSLPTCNATNITDDSDPLGCAECLIRPRSFEEHWCELWRQVDDALEPVFVVRVFEPLLCCTPMAALRTLVGFAKWLVDFLVHFLAGIDRLAIYAANSSAWSAPWTELAGSPTQFGGLLGCICALFTIDEEDTLHCLCVLLTYPFKSLFEAVRILVLFVPSTVNAILEASGSPLYDTGQPTVLEQLCIAGTGPFCLDLEQKLFKWWRVPRDRSTLFQNVTVPITGGDDVNGTMPVLEYLPLNTTGTMPVTLVSSAIGTPGLVIPGTGTGVLFDPVTGQVFVYSTGLLLDLVEAVEGDTLLPLPGLDFLPVTFVNDKIILQEGVPVVANGTWIYTVAYGVSDNVTITVARVPNDNWVDCLCFVLSIEFVNQYLDEPIDGSNLPDICCAIRFTVRLIVELVKTLLEFLLGIVQTLVAVFGSNSNDPLVLLCWLACDPETELCSPLVEVMSDLQDLLFCPCLIVDAIEIDGIGIPCLCNAINAFVMGLIELLLALVTLGKALLASVKCIFYEDQGPDDEACGVLLLQRYKQFLQAIVSSLDHFSASFGNIGCLIGLIFPIGCVDYVANPLECAFLLEQGDIYATADTCTGPLPPDNEDDPPLYVSPGGFPVNTCACSPLQRFRLLFERFFDLVALIIVVPVEFLCTLVEFIQTLVATDSVSIDNLGALIVDFFQLLGIEIVHALVGDASSTGTDFYGLVQAFGFVFNCLFGPPNCANNPNTICVGDIFVLLGDSLREILGCLVGTEVYDPPYMMGDSYDGDVLFMPFRILFGILAGDDVSALIGFFLDGLFCLVAAIFRLLESVFLDLVEGIVTAILCLIFAPIFGEDACTTVIAPIVGVIFDFIGLIFGFLEILACIFEAEDIFQVGDCFFAAKRAAGASDNYADYGTEHDSSLFGLIFTPKQIMKLFEEPSRFADEEMGGRDSSLCARTIASYGSVKPAERTPEQALVYRLCLVATLAPDAINRHILTRAAPVQKDIRKRLLLQEHGGGSGGGGNNTHSALDPSLLPLLPLDVLHSTSGLLAYIRDMRPVLDALRQWQQGKLVVPANPFTGRAATRTVILDEETDVDVPYYCSANNAHSDANAVCTFRPKPVYTNITLAEFFAARGLVESALARQYVGAQTLLSAKHGETQRTQLASLIHLGIKTLQPDMMRRTLRESLNHARRHIWQNVQHGAASSSSSSSSSSLSSALPYPALASPTQSSSNHTRRSNSTNMVVHGISHGLLPVLLRLPEAPKGHDGWFALGKVVLAGMWRRHIKERPLWDRMASLPSVLVEWQSRHAVARGVGSSFVDQQVGGLIAMHRRVASVTGSTCMAEQVEMLTGWWQTHSQRVEQRLALAAKRRTHTMDSAGADTNAGNEATADVYSNDTIASAATTTMMRTASKRATVQFNAPWPRCNVSAPGDPCFDCAILDEFLNETVVLFSLCVERNEGLAPPINVNATGDLGINIVEVGEEAPFVSGSGLLADAANALLNFLNSLVGFDLVATLFNLLTTTNTDPSQGPVGIYAFIPYVTRCERDLHLQCNYGLGVERALVLTLCLVLLVPLVLSAILPPLATFFMAIISLFTLQRVFLLVFAFLAWGYNPTCFDSPGTTLLTALLPFTFVLPTIPECAPRQLVVFANTYLVPCLFPLLPETWQAGVREGTPLCPDCPNLIDMYDCVSEFGFSTGSDAIGYLLAMGNFIIPADVGLWLQSTCLVRGGCLFGLGQTPGEDTGILAGLFGVPEGILMANETGIGNETLASLTLDYCAATMSVAALGDLALAFLIAIVLFYAWPIAVALVQAFLAFYTWLFGSLTSSQPESMESAELPPVPDGLVLDLLSAQERRLARLEQALANEALMETAGGTGDPGAGT